MENGKVKIIILTVGEIKMIIIQSELFSGTIYS